MLSTVDTHAVGLARGSGCIAISSFDSPCQTVVLVRSITTMYQSTKAMRLLSPIKRVDIGTAFSFIGGLAHQFHQIFQIVARFLAFYHCLYEL
jgi:hypothetical protein